MATKSIAWDTGNGNITLTYQGQGDGTITVQSDPNILGTSRSQIITVETIGGAITKNFTISQAACPVPVGTVLTYSYTGTYQEVTLPAGKYKLQCWGAQGGSNAAASSYSITAKAGGKGGYSEGVITLSSPTTVRVYVGGAGSSSAGGFNGGGNTTGSSTYNASNEQGVSRMGGGGGATDIRLSDGALLSRMIVAGGGSGGAYCYRSKITTETVTDSVDVNSLEVGLMINDSNVWVEMHDEGDVYGGDIIDLTSWQGGTIKLTSSTSTLMYAFVDNYSVGSAVQFTNGGSVQTKRVSSVTENIPSNAKYIWIYVQNNQWSWRPSSITLSKTVSSTQTASEYQYGFPGGGTTGIGYDSSYNGRQYAAGDGGSFGQGANQTTTGYRYCSGAGGGGWYGGGGGKKSDNSMTYVHYSGGGSGWVNTAASAGNRPSGYTGLELDSGTTYAGNTSFPNTSGTGNETGHSGNGYAKITRIE